MKKSTYVVWYHVFDKKGFLIKGNGLINCYNRLSEMDAKIKLETYLKKKYPNFGKLIVVSCDKDQREWIFKKIDSIMDQMSNLMDNVNNLFNSLYKKNE